MNALKTLAYGVLDICTLRRGVARTICGEPIRFPTRWHRYYPAEYEPGTFAFLRGACKPGGTAMDIGAHLGLFTAVMARLVGPTGRVYSFEPTPQTRAILRKTVRLNHCEALVEVRDEAVSAATGPAVFYNTGFDVSNANSLVRTSKSRSGLEVLTVRLDDFVTQRGIAVDCLKIDVEGAELEVLRGARRTFANCRPLSMLALHPEPIKAGGGSLAEIWDVLSDYRLSVRLLNACDPVGPGAGHEVDKNWFVRQHDLFDVALIPVSD